MRLETARRRLAAFPGLEEHFRCTVRLALEAAKLLRLPRPAELAEAVEHRRKDGVLFARQFAVEEERVLAVVKELKKLGKGA